MGQTQSSAGRKGGRLADKLRPFGRAVPVAHRWGIFSSKGEAAGWNRKKGSLHFWLQAADSHRAEQVPPTLEALFVVMYVFYYAGILSIEKHQKKTKVWYKNKYKEQFRFLPTSQWKVFHSLAHVYPSRHLPFFYMGNYAACELYISTAVMWKKGRMPAGRRWGHLGRLCNTKMRYKEEFVSLCCGVPWRLCHGSWCKTWKWEGAFLDSGTESSPQTGAGWSGASEEGPDPRSLVSQPKLSEWVLKLRVTRPGLHLRKIILAAESMGKG